MRLTIVVPACNEERRIGRMLDAYLPYFTARYGADVEFVVVVNGSRDGTEGVVREYQSRYPGLRMLVEPGRIGKGGALIKGFGAARGDLVGFCDADGATPPEAWQALVDNLGDADCVIASRWRRGSVVSPRQPLVRLLSSRIFNWTTRLLFGLRLTDTQCGAKLMRREALAGVLPSLGITQWAFDVDLLLHLKRMGRRIREIPTTWHDIAGSKVEIARASVEMFAALVRLRLLYSPLRWVVPLYDRYIGPFVHPAQMEEDRLFRHSLLLMAGAQVANLLNMTFQFAMAWLLTNGEFAVLAAMMGLVANAVSPFGALGQTLSHYTSAFLKDGSREGVNGLARRAARDVTVLVILLALVAGLGGVGVMQTFYQLDSAKPLWVALALAAVSLYGLIPGSVLNGAQAFIWSSGLGIVWSVVRLAVSVALVALGCGVSGALSGIVLAQGICLALGFYGMWQVLGTRARQTEEAPGFYAYCLKYVAASAAFSMFMVGDATIVKHYFSAEDAGLFAKAAIVARIVIFLPAPIATALFPKVVSSGDTERGHIRSLLKAGVLTGAMVLAGALLCTLLPAFLLRVLTRTTAPEAVPLLRGMVWALVPISLLQIVMSFELAQRRFAVGGVLVAGALAYAGLCTLWHASLLHIPLILGVCGAVTLAVAAARLPWRELRRQPAA